MCVYCRKGSSGGKKIIRRYLVVLLLKNERVDGLGVPGVIFQEKKRKWFRTFFFCFLWRERKWGSVRGLPVGFDHDRSLRIVCHGSHSSLFLVIFVQSAKRETRIEKWINKQTKKKPPSCWWLSLEGLGKNNSRQIYRRCMGQFTGYCSSLREMI